MSRLRKPIARDNDALGKSVMLEGYALDGRFNPRVH